MKGLELVNAATAELTVDPLPAKPEPEAQQASGWDEVHRSIFKAMAEDGHPPILEEHDGKPMVKLHTCWLRGDHRRNHRAGRYSTASEGADLSKPNAFGFPLPNGGIAIYRFGDAAETADWHRTANGRMCIHYNVAIPDVAKPRLLTCKQLDTERYNIRYHISGALAAVQNHIIGGRQKTLKTTIAVDAAISLASGLPFLGSLPVTQACRVVMFSAESSLSVLQETARRICKSKEVCLPDIDGLFWSEWLPRLDSAKHLEALKQTVQETQAEVLFLDPCYLMMPGADAGNVFAQGERLRGISEICQEHGVCPVLLHHLRKRGKGDHSYDPPELDELSWSGFAEYARQWWLIGRREAYEVGSGSHRLWLSVGGSAGHNALLALDIEEGRAGEPRRWEVSVSRPDEARAAKKENTVRQRIYDAAREFPAGETKTGILTVAKVKSDAAVRAIFDAMVNEGLLVRCSVKKGAAGYEGFRLATPEATSCTT